MDLEKNTHHHHGRHEGRDDLTGEYKSGDAGQLILLIIFLAVWISDSFFLEYSTFLREGIRWYIRIVPGILFLAAGGYLARSGLNTVFGEVRERPQVITKGPFSVVRHPIYLGSVLFYLGVTVITMSLASAAVCIIIILFYYYISRHEEKLLLARFGKEYETYMGKVPMLLPVKLRF